MCVAKIDSRRIRKLMNAIAIKEIKSRVKIRFYTQIVLRASFAK